MKKNFKRAVSAVVSAVLCVTMTAPLYVGAEQQNHTVAGDSFMQNDISVTGTNSFGTMLADVMNAEMDEQQENNGFNIFSVEMSGNTATVELETLRDSTVVVGIYDESGSTLIDTARAKVTADDEQAKVTFTKTLPQYFYIKAYLIDTFSMRPLCTVYENPNYTKEMQEFLSKTVNDFEPDRVLNLDNDRTNNFAVYGDDIKIISENVGIDYSDCMSSEYKDENIPPQIHTTTWYSLYNIDGTVKSLKKGDIFSLKFKDDIVIDRVYNISINGDKATITTYSHDDPIEMEEVFDYVKIDTEGGIVESNVDASGMSDGVTYNGLVDYNESDIAPMAFDYEGKTGAALSFDIAKKEYEIEGDSSKVKSSITGNLTFKIEASAKVYISMSYQYLELKVDYSAKLSLKLSISGQMTFELASIKIMPFPAVVIELQPSVIAKADVEIEVNGTIKGTVGFEVSSEYGARSLTSDPTFKSEIKVTGTFFIGFSLEPKVEIVSDKIAKVGLKAIAGVEIKGVIQKDITASSSKKHDCFDGDDYCIDGEISAKVSFSFEVSLLNLEKLTFKVTIAEYTLKLFDFYYSHKFNEFDVTKCPHLSYKLNVTVQDINGEAIADAAVYIDSEYQPLDSNGKMIIYLPNGDHTVTAAKKGFYEKTKRVLINDGSEEIIIILDRKTTNSSGNESGGGSTGGGSSGGGGSSWGDDTPTGSQRIKQVSLGYNHSAAITEDGSLYMWGSNYYGQLGDGTTTDSYVPIKIMDNVAYVSLGGYFSAAITTNGDLYMWGVNSSGQLGNGTTGNSSLPVKVLDNVVYVNAETAYCLAITANGDLYAWGYNNYGNGVVDDNTFSSYVPVKIMNNVISVSRGDYHIAAITENGDLYTWGDNSFGQLGNSTATRSSVPIKIMNNVVSVSLGDRHSAAITKNGDLYMWGDNSHGQLGDGTTSGTLHYDSNPIPQNLMDNIASVNLGTFCSAAVTTSGDLYTWGWNYLGRLGNGSTSTMFDNCLIPTKIMSNVTSLTYGYDNSAAITTDGSLYMWGNNSTGKLGNGTKENSSLPVKVMNNVVSVSLGNNHSAAITKDDNLYMWGSGYLGNGTTSSSVPVKIEIPYETASYSMLAASAETSFTGLLPNEVYNIYGMKSRTVSDPFSSDNLLYISQGVTDSTGKLTYNYQPVAESTDPIIFCKAMTEFDVGNAQITGGSVTDNSITIKWDAYPGANMYKVYRVINGVYIEETETSATSCTISGLASGREYGFMVASRVNGEWSYRSSDDVIYIYTEEKSGIDGDINKDGFFDIDDVIDLARSILTTTDPAKNPYLPDGDRDESGKIDIDDVILLARQLIM